MEMAGHRSQVRIQWKTSERVTERKKGNGKGEVGRYTSVCVCVQERARGRDRERKREREREREKGRERGEREGIKEMNCENKRE